MESRVAVQGGSPEEGLRIFIPGRQELPDRGDELVDAVKRTAADPLAGQFRKPAFHQVQPTATGRHIVDHKAGMFLEPGFDLGMPVRTVVVHDQVQGFPARKFAIHAGKPCTWSWTTTVRTGMPR